MSESQPKTITTEQLRAAPTKALQGTGGPAPLVVTRDGRVLAYVFRDTTPLEDNQKR